MARVIAVCNQKGGVGKTTTAVNLGAYLVSHGRRVLLVDFDPQANASSALGHDVASSEPVIYHGILGKHEPEAILKKSPILGYDFAPSNPQLTGALVELVNIPQREYFLRSFLNKIRHNYDYALIDLPPSLSLLTINGLVAADEILIPVQAEYYSLEGLGQLLTTVSLIKSNMRHNLKVAGAVITMYDRRERLSRDVAKDLRRNFPHHVYDVEIPRCVSLAEAPSFARPIMLYAPYSRGALAYRRLSGEVIGQEEAHTVQQEYGDFNIKITQ